MRVCWAKHKIEGGIIPLQTTEIESACDVLGMAEDKYSEFLKNLHLGKKYLVSRETLSSLSKEKADLIAKEVEIKLEKETRFKPVLKEIESRKFKREPRFEIPGKRFEVEEPKPEEKETTQHHYLQNLIKRFAEEKGYRAVIEQPTPDGAGRVDVGLERNGKKIACEISVTSTSEQELSNIEKCFQAGYDQVILCSPEKKALEKIRAFVFQNLKDFDNQKLSFFQPEELFFYLEESAAKEISKEETVKGYKVKVQYQIVRETDKKTKRAAVGQVIL